MKCAKCGRTVGESSFIGSAEAVNVTEGSPIVLIEGDDHDDFCYDCGVQELRRRLKGIPISIEVPQYPEYSAEELQCHGAAINYTAELIDFPPHKG